MPLPDWMRKLQLVEVEMLDEAVRICEKHNLTYYLEAGTLLGAVRHKGFIPWDDDIDISMPREDFDKFKQIAQTELNPPFHLESFETDPNSPHAFMRIRNKNTLYETQRSRELGLLCMGIWIDILPLDDQPGAHTLRQRIDWALLNLYKHILIRYRRNNKERTILGKMQFALIRVFPFEFYVRMRNRLITKYNGKQYPYWKMPVLVYDYKRETFPKAWYEPHATLKFEGRQFTVPGHYHETLTQLYGDYMQLPPVESRKLHAPVRVSFDLNGPDEIIPSDKQDYSAET